MSIVTLDAGSFDVVYREGPAPRLYYIQDTRSYVGNAVVWWGPNRSGYTTHIKEAGVYSEAEAKEHERSRSTDKAWPCDVVNPLIRKYVDAQDLHRVKRE